MIVDYPPEEPFDLMKVMSEMIKEERKNYKPHVIQIPMQYLLDRTCEELRVLDKIDGYNFIGGLETYEKVKKKCEECGIKL